MVKKKKLKHSGFVRQVIQLEGKADVTQNCGN